MRRMVVLVWLEVGVERSWLEEPSVGTIKEMTRLYIYRY